MVQIYKERNLAMKRIFVLLLTLVMCLSMFACGNDGKDNTTADETSESSEMVTSSQVVTTTEEYIPPVLYRHPLTGEPIDKPWTGRATSVVINNIKNALPQYGVSQADILYEVETEGFITRMMAVFTDLSTVKGIGPVRSARTYFNNLAMAYDSPLVHCGGGSQALRGQYSWDEDTISGWEHINQFYNGKYFYRDKERYEKLGYAWEHTLFTNGELLTKALKARKYNKTYKEQQDYNMTFAEEIDLDGKQAQEVVIKFAGNKTTTMTYDQDTGRYMMSQYGAQTVDGANNAKVSFRNVIVLYTNHYKRQYGSKTRSYYDLQGSGKGHFACNGEIIPIKWSRPKLRGPYEFTTEDGKPITFGVGKTYIGVVSKKNTATFK